MSRRSRSRSSSTASIPPRSVARADLYVLVNAVTGLAPGAYFYARDRHALVPLARGELRREAGFLGLGQDIPADAAVNLYWLTELAPIFAALGNRGYRTAQLEAAVAGGRTYLAAYALGLGASGLTFFDDDVTRFFSPHAAGKSRQGIAESLATVTPALFIAGKSRPSAATVRQLLYGWSFNARARAAGPPQDRLLRVQRWVAANTRPIVPSRWS